MRPRSPLPVVLALTLLAACAGPRATRCGDTVGAWSAPAGGLRARLVTSGARADRSVLAVSLDLDNVADAPLALHWVGMLDLGFATFALTDATGGPVAPALAWGGNGPGGSFREVLPARAVVRHRVATNLFVPVSGRRLVRIGAFGGGWPMADDGSPRHLYARLVGGAATGDELVVHVDDPTSGGLSVSQAPASDPADRAWIGALDVPPVCID